MALSARAAADAGEPRVRLNPWREEPPHRGSARRLRLRRRTSPAGGAGRHRTGCAVRRGGCRRGFPPRADRRRRACSSSLARPARALAPTVEALPLMVCRVAALPTDIALAELAFELGEEVLHVRNEAPQHTDDQLQAAAETPDDIAPRLDQFARVRCRCRRAPGAAPAEMTEQAKHQALLVDRLRHMVVHARRQAAAVGQQALAVMARSAARRSARRRGFSGSPRDHRYPASACPSAPRRTARSPPAPAERPPARRRRGPRRPRCQLGGDLAVQRVVLHYQQTHAPQTAGCAPPGAAAGWPGRPVRRATHAAPSRPVAWA